MCGDKIDPVVTIYTSGGFNTNVCWYFINRYTPGCYRCMTSKFCAKFQRVPLRFHTKFWTNTPQNIHFADFYVCVWFTMYLKKSSRTAAQGYTVGYRAPYVHSSEFQFLFKNLHRLESSYFKSDFMQIVTGDLISHAFRKEWNWSIWKVENNYQFCT